MFSAVAVQSASWSSRRIAARKENSMQRMNESSQRRWCRGCARGACWCSPGLCPDEWHGAARRQAGRSWRGTGREAGLQSRRRKEPSGMPEREKRDVKHGGTADSAAPAAPAAPAPAARTGAITARAGAAARLGGRPARRLAATAIREKSFRFIPRSPRLIGRIDQREVATSAGTSPRRERGEESFRVGPQRFGQRAGSVRRLLRGVLRPWRRRTPG